MKIINRVGMAQFSKGLKSWLWHLALILINPDRFIVHNVVTNINIRNTKEAVGGPQYSPRLSYWLHRRATVSIIAKGCILS